MDPTPEQVLNQPEMMVRNDANWIKLRDYELIHLIRDYEEKQRAGDESTPLLS